MEDGEEDPVEKIRKTYETEERPVFVISAVTHEGIKELLSYVMKRLSEMPREITTYAPEFEYEYDKGADLPFTVERTGEREFTVEGPRIEKMLGYTNLDSEKGFQFFQQFIVKSGIQKQLEQLGIEEGDTVRMYGHSFEFYR